MSIAPPVGALNKYLSRLLSSKEFRSLRHLGREIVERFPKPVEVAAKRAEEYARGLVTGGTLFEELRSEEHTSELQSLMRISYAAFCLKKKPVKTPTPEV